MNKVIESIQSGNSSEERQENPELIRVCQHVVQAH